MKDKHPSLWTSVISFLKAAALLPQQRDEFVTRALGQMLDCFPAAGVALIWPCQERKIPWRVYYMGIRRAEMYGWLSAHLDYSLDVVAANVRQGPPGSLSEMPPPLLTHLHVMQSALSALWFIWPVSPAVSLAPGAEGVWMTHVRQALEALLEVEEKEKQFFSPSSPLYDQAFIQALAHGDAQVLSAFLGLVRVVAQADFTFWARAYQDIVEVSGHLGAKHGDFGFALARGHGVGGRVAAYGTPMLGDYRNSPYREPVICDIVDSEQIRSGITLPVRYQIAPDKSAHVAAVLYTTRRVTTHFSLAERLLVQRLVGLLEPFPFEEHPVSFAAPGIPSFPAHKMDWYRLVLHANQIEAVEAWASQLIKGTVIVTDSQGSPYVLAHSEQLEQIRSLRDTQPGMTQTLSLSLPREHPSGQVYLCPSLTLPPPHWPDFFADLLVACNVVIARMEQAQGQLDRQRERWLRALVQGEVSQQIEQDGYRLGLPVKSGQVWIFAWPQGTVQATKLSRLRVIAENVVLNSLKSPLIFFEDDLAVALLQGPARCPPSETHNALLKYCGAHPPWIVHGGSYSSPLELKMTLTHMLALAQKACREAYEEYILDISTFGLDSLLENPRLADELDTFARKLLTPLIEYDKANKSHLTETFVLARTLGSVQAVAEQLGVHINTIRYRLHRSEDLLGTEQASPKEQTTMTLAAFAWQRFHSL